MLKRFKRKAPAEIVLHCLVSVLFAVIAASYAYIFIWTLISSLKTHTEVVLDPFSLPAVWNWKNYIEVTQIFEVNGHGFWEMLFNSVWFSVVGPFLSQLTTITFAYCCTKYEFKGSKWIYTIILIMLTLPIYGSGGASYKLYKNLGMIDTYAHVLCAMSGYGLPFLYYRAYYQNVSWTYAEAAMMDGADHFKIYTKVMFPQAKPIFSALYLTSWLGSWNEYASTLIYLPNLPTLPVGIYQFNQEMIYQARLDILFAACVIVSIPALILFIAFNKVLTTNVSIGGIKG